jgi:hypothetical protein
MVVVPPVQTISALGASFLIVSQTSKAHFIIQFSQTHITQITSIFD